MTRPPGWIRSHGSWTWSGPSTRSEASVTNPLLYPGQVAAEHPERPAVVIAATGESIGSADLDAFANRLSHVLKLPDEVSARYDVSSLTHATHAAAPCPVDVKQRMLDWWAPVIHEFYAGTEGAGICCSDDVVRLVAAAGRHDQIAAAAAERFEGLVDTLAIAPAPGLDVRLPAAVIQAIRAVPPTRHADRDGEH